MSRFKFVTNVGKSTTKPPAMGAAQLEFRFHFVYYCLWHIALDKGQPGLVAHLGAALCAVAHPGHEAHYGPAHHLDAHFLHHHPGGAARQGLRQAAIHPNPGFFSLWPLHRCHDVAHGLHAGALRPQPLLGLSPAPGRTAGRGRHPGPGHRLRGAVRLLPAGWRGLSPWP